METQPTSLYERLGGIYNIATVVDDFIDRIMVDDRLNANPRVDEAHHRVLPDFASFVFHSGAVGARPLSRTAGRATRPRDSPASHAVLRSPVAPGRGGRRARRAR